MPDRCWPIPCYFAVRFLTASLIALLVLIYRFDVQNFPVIAGREAGRKATLRAVRNLVRFTGASVPDAVAAASAWPAKILGLKNLGSISEGAEADLVLVDDKFSLKKIIFRGELLDGVSDV